MPMPVRLEGRPAEQLSRQSLDLIGNMGSFAGILYRPIELEK
jgi:hypothetical protein